jgi:acetate kinase
MKILVINSGSSSIKYQIFDMPDASVIASGLLERIGESASTLIHRWQDEAGEEQKIVRTQPISNHQEGFELIAAVNSESGAVREADELSGIGHRVVHGGETFHTPTLIDGRVIAAIKENIPLAPLHNPANLMGIEIAKAAFPHAPQVAVFDTAFHQTIPMKAFLYAIPFELYEKEKIRRYGFHGTSHAYVAESAADYLGRPVSDLNLITIHLGNGASMAAIKKGRCVDTTMGMTPLAGLVMGTRCGDVDPALPFFLADHLGMSLKEIDQLLNKESGLKGICGTNDMRELIKKKDGGDERAKIALDVYTYRIKKFIGAYFAALESLDALVFTAGIGENAPSIRELCCRGLHQLGIEIDPERNGQSGNTVREINSSNSRIKVLVVPTNEELRIAQETIKVIEQNPSSG